MGNRDISCNTKEFPLKRAEFHNTVHISGMVEKFKSDFELRKFYNELYCSMTHNIIFRALYNPGPSLEFPLNWFESLKQRWYPAWLLKRYPVKYATYYARAYFPGLHKDTRAIYTWEFDPPSSRED